MAASRITAMSRTVHLWVSSYSPTQLVKWAVSAMPSSSSFSFISATNASWEPAT